MCLSRLSFTKSELGFTEYWHVATEHLRSTLGVYWGSGLVWADDCRGPSSDGPGGGGSDSPGRGDREADDGTKALDGSDELQDEEESKDE
jgi:hypothetical protein